MAEIEVKGLDELGRALSEFPEVMAKKYLRRATFTAARVFADDAALRASGAPLYHDAMAQIAKNIAVFKRSAPNGTAHYAVGVRRVRISRKIKNVIRILRRAGQTTRIENDTFFWHWYEFGTEERYTKGGAARGRIIAQPYLRPAFEAQKEAAVDAFKADLAEGVAAAAREVAK
jgi:HK97 gp10 family phage protein